MRVRLRTAGICLAYRRVAQATAGLTIAQARDKWCVVHGIRAFLQKHSVLAAWVVAAALALRVLVPGGFMPTIDHGRIVMTICNGSPDGPGTMVMALPGMEHKQQPGDVASGKCAYADLAQAMTGGMDAILLAVALAFATALALLLTFALPARPAAFLRPPLRGPPARA